MPLPRLRLLAGFLLATALPLSAASSDGVIRLAQESDAAPQAEETPVKKQEQEEEEKKPDLKAEQRDAPVKVENAEPPAMKRERPQREQVNEVAPNKVEAVEPNRTDDDSKPRRMRMRQSEDNSDASPQSDENQDKPRSRRQRPQNSEDALKPSADSVLEKKDDEARKPEAEKPEAPKSQPATSETKDDQQPEKAGPDSDENPPPVIDPAQPRPEKKGEAETLQEREPVRQAPLPEDDTADDKGATTFNPGFKPAAPESDNIQDVQKHRRERKDDDGRRTLIEEPDNRVIVREGDRTIIRHDESERFAKGARDVRSERRKGGGVETVIRRDDGSELFNIMDDNGRVMRRYKRDRNGRETNIIDNRDFYKGAAAGALIGLGLGAAANIDLPPPRLRIPRKEYVVDYDDASDDELYDTLTAPPVEELSRAYSLEEIRYNARLRERTRRVDLDAVNFASGSWKVSPGQYASLKRVARTLLRAIERNPAEVFLIEGHTDAVGSDIDNLSLSDRRAESVAEILSDIFDVPPENLVTQGYGEQYLKIDTDEPNASNRRVAIRRITPLMTRR